MDKCAVDPPGSADIGLEAEPADDPLERAVIALAVTAWALTETFEVSAMSSLSSRRSPSPASDRVCSNSARVCASSAPRQVISTV
jgi:hypothetical protein